MNQRIAPLLTILLLFVPLHPIVSMGKSEGAIQKTWDFPESVRTLVVDADEQDIVVKATSEHGSGRLVGDRGSEVRVVRDGDRVTITIRSHRGWLSWSRRSSRVELQVPADMDLTLSTDSGAVLVEAPTRALIMRSASGDIEAPRGGKDVDADSTSGTVRLRGFDGTVRANAVSGGVVLEKTAGSIVATCLSGNIEGRDLSPAEGSRFSVVSGDIDLSFSGGIGLYHGRAETISGEIEVGELRGQSVLDWGTQGPRITTKSVSGNVRLR